MKSPAKCAVIRQAERMLTDASSFFSSLISRTYAIESRPLAVRMPIYEGHDYCMNALKSSCFAATAASTF